MKIINDKVKEMKKNPRAWSTELELEVINYIGSDEKRSTGKKLTIAERKSRLAGYLISAEKREWPFYMDKLTCINHARILLASL